MIVSMSAPAPAAETTSPPPLRAALARLARPGVAVVLVMGLALALRALQLAAVRDDIFFLHPHADSMQYRDWALNIMRGDWLGRDVPVFYQAPLYPYFLAGLFSVFGTSLLAVGGVQVLLSTATVGMIYRVALDLFGSRTALVAGTMAAVYGMAIFYSSILLGATLILFFNSALLMCLVSGIRRPAAWKFAFAGVCLGLSAATRANVLLFAPFAGLAIASGLGMRDWRRWLPAGCVFGIGLVVVLAPITLHNRLMGDDWVMISSNAGANFFIGNSRGSDGIYGSMPTYHGEPIGSSVSEQQIIFPGIATRELGRDDMRPSEISSFWMNRTLLDIRSDESRWLSLLAHKLKYLVNAYEVPNNRSYHFSQQFSPLLRAPLLSFGVLFPLGLLGLLVCGRPTGAKSLLPGFFVAHCLALLLFFVNARYRLVLAPVLIVYAAAFVVWLRGQMRRARYTQLVVSLVALYAVYVVTFVAVPAWSFRGAWMNMGNAHRDRGEPDAALESYDRALALSPDYYHVMWRKGGVLADTGHAAEAREVFERGLELSVQNGDTLYTERFSSQLLGGGLR